MAKRRYKTTKFRLRRQPAKPNWYICWTEAGKPRKVSTGTENETEAYSYLREFELNFNAYKAESANINKIIDIYLDKKESEMKLAGTYTRGSGFQKLELSFKSVRDFFGEYLPNQLTHTIVNNYKELHSNLAPKTIRNYLTNLTAALNSAKNEGLIDCEIIKIKLPPKITKDKKEVLSEEEVIELLNIIEHPHLKTYCYLAFFTAQRGIDILSLTWDRVDFENNVINFKDASINTGNKKQAAIPMTNEVLEIMKEAYDIAETKFVIEYLGKPVKSIKRSFNAAIKKVTDKKITPYCMKHTAITLLAKKGIPFWEISILTGVDSRTLEQHYAHIHPDYLKRSVSYLNELITARGKKRIISKTKKPSKTSP